MQICTGGWGVILGADTSPQVRQALQPLLEHRQAEAGDRYREFYLNTSSETASEFLLRHGVGPGPANLQRVPYYILLVGSPEEITFPFQYQLGVQHGVGRVFFESPDGYYNYATNVVAAEKSDKLTRKRLVFFIPAHIRDLITQEMFALALRLENFLSSRFRTWEIGRFDHSRATKTTLAEILASHERMPLLLILSHGARFDSGHPLQSSNEGGILCAEFYEKNASGIVNDMTNEVMFCKDDIPNMSRVNVDILFLDACRSAGTAEFDDLPSTAPTNNLDACRGAGAAEFNDLPSTAPTDNRRRLAPSDCLAPLPLGLLSSFADGPLAVIGHVNDPSNLSFKWRGVWTESQTYEITLSRLLEGYPVGFAVKPYVQKFVDILAMIHPFNTNLRGHRIDDDTREELYRMAIGERNLIILGDPAVRIRVK
jgi:hypothetical protein